MARTRHPRHRARVAAAAGLEAAATMVAHQAQGNVAEEFEPAEIAANPPSADLTTDRNRVAQAIEAVQDIIPEQMYIELYNGLKTLCENATDREAALINRSNGIIDSLVNRIVSRGLY